MSIIKEMYEEVIIEYYTDDDTTSIIDDDEEIIYEEEVIEKEIIKGLPVVLEGNSDDDCNPKNVHSTCLVPSLRYCRWIICRVSNLS
jgi:hypothetical protein